MKADFCVFSHLLINVSGRVGGRRRKGMETTPVYLSVDLYTYLPQL